MLLLGLAAQRHGLSHAIEAVQWQAHGHAADAHAKACEQCLQFAACHGVPVDIALLLLPDTRQTPSSAPGIPARPADPFSAYISRAPPTFA